MPVRLRDSLTMERVMRMAEKPQCPDCKGLGYAEYRPTCQLCGVLETEPHDHPIERVTCSTCRGDGKLSPLAMAVRKARGGPPPPPPARGFA